MSIGDFTADDATDTAPPDPEQVARKLAELEGGPMWDDLTDAARSGRILTMGLLLAWLVRQGPARGG